MRGWICLLLLLGAGLPLRAQPGGGGGLLVKRIYLQRGRQLAPADTGTVRPRVFLLTDTTTQARIMWEHSAPYFASADRVRDTVAAFLPPATGRTDTIARLLLTDGPQLMLVDFIGVLREGSGHWQRMDSLVFMPGHFRLRLARYPLYCNGEDDQRQTYDLTPRSLTGWQVAGALSYQPAVSLDFLADRNLTATYFQDRGWQHLMLAHQPQAALTDLRRAFRLGLSAEAQPAAYETLAAAYRGLGRYDSAATALSAAIRLLDPQGRADLDLNKNNDAYRLETWYNDRIDDYIRAGKYDRALAEYNEMIRRAAPSYEWQYIHGRAWLKAQHFRGRPEYAQATTDLLRLLKPLPPKPPSVGFSEGAYSRWAMALLDKQGILLTLGQVEYEQGKPQVAFRHFVEAYELNDGTYLSNGLVPYFDQLLAKHPHEPQLLLTRALAHLSAAQLIASTNNSYDEALAHAQAALTDLAAAQHYGLDAIRVSAYRSRLLGLAKEYDKRARVR